MSIPHEMTEPITIRTDRDDVSLRQLGGEADYRDFLDLLQVNRDHLLPFLRCEINRFRDLESVAQSNDCNLGHTLEEGYDLRLGIYHGQELVGSGLAIPSYYEDAIDVEYWLGREYMGHGLATAAVIALSRHCQSRAQTVKALIADKNEASIKVALRADFVPTDVMLRGCRVYELSKGLVASTVTKPQVL